MRIGIVSDTHGNVVNTRAAADVLQALDVSLVLHCGDIGTQAVLPYFEDWPTHFVFGNCDYQQDLLRKWIESLGQTCHGAFGSLELEGKKIAILHSHDHNRFTETIHSGEWDLVCYGHTHIPEHHLEGKTLVLNPGALYRANPHTLAVVNLPELTVESHQV